MMITRSAYSTSRAPTTKGLDTIGERDRTSLMAKMISKMSFLAMARGAVDAYPSWVGRAHASGLTPEMP
jgi:hypothetical protein